MVHFVTVIHIINCILLVLVVLMQQGKKDGMGAAFGGGSQSVFGARGAETFLEKFTKVLAVIFMCTSLTLVYYSSKGASNSLLSDEKAPAPIAAPATTAPAATAAPVTTTTAEPATTAAPASVPVPASSAPATKK